MQRWLLRLRYSFLVLAAVCAWEGSRSAGTRAVLLYMGAILLGLLALQAIRQQHGEK
jgi:NADH:ubiquinone oxidoreductase subunit 6 (subunit J)